MSAQYFYKENKINGKQEKKGRETNATAKISVLLLKPANPTPSNAGSPTSFHRDTDSQLKFSGAEKFCTEEAHKFIDL